MKKLSDEIAELIESEDSGTKLDIKGKLREWLPRIQDLEYAVAKVGSSAGSDCEICGFYTGVPCERMDCPMNTD